MADRIKHQLFFPHPPEQVWEYLTRADLMQLWLMPNDFKPTIGHEFQFKTKPMPQLDFDGIVYCKVLEIAPHHTLSYSWKSGPGNGKIELDSIVTWKLVPKDNGTELLLEHGAFKGFDHLGMFSALDGGWFKNMHKIAELLNVANRETTTL
ncbi:MAG: SRPBCC domain-containing protein [Bacteroidota bacterium]|nr:SRPBCC domain-containing protein [Bacteroidota bacterium]MDP4246443.1 SRPBCC domain-containing protein [Bacteroidota bacterium]MDP4254234.1 SRPBCC domain-containing protein [Bacteroidota bacterium]MDP4260075.1 SRPBCC domain-containing protein [Bacteroidota bacterium]